MDPDKLHKDFLIRYMAQQNRILKEKFISATSIEYGEQINTLCFRAVFTRPVGSQVLVDECVIAALAN